jgi:hypothetical protein
MALIPRPAFQSAGPIHLPRDTRYSEDSQWHHVFRHMVGSSRLFQVTRIIQVLLQSHTKQEPSHTADSIDVMAADCPCEQVLSSTILLC